MDGVKVPTASASRQTNILLFFVLVHNLAHETCARAEKTTGSMRHERFFHLLNHMVSIWRVRFTLIAYDHSQTENRGVRSQSLVIIDLFAIKQ
jgi:hypothetical protein